MPDGHRLRAHAATRCQPSTPPTSAPLGGVSAQTSRQAEDDGQGDEPERPVDVAKQARALRPAGISERLAAGRATSTRGSARTPLPASPPVPRTAPVPVGSLMSFFGSGKLVRASRRVTDLDRVVDVARRRADAEGQRGGGRALARGGRVVDHDIVHTRPGPGMHAGTACHSARRPPPRRSGQRPGGAVVASRAGATRRPAAFGTRMTSTACCPSSCIVRYRWPGRRPATLMGPMKSRSFARDLPCAGSRR